MNVFNRAIERQKEAREKARKLRAKLKEKEAEARKKAEAGAAAAAGIGSSGISTPKAQKTDKTNKPKVKPEEPSELDIFQLGQQKFKNVVSDHVKAHLSGSPQEEELQRWQNK